MMVDPIEQTMGISDSSLKRVCFMCPIGGGIMREIEPRYPAFILVKRTAYMLICTPIIELKKDMEWGALAQALTISKENIFCPYASLTGKAI